MCPELQGLAEDADLFLCHTGACFGRGNPLFWGHLTPDEAGTLARAAHVKRLLLTHLWPACDRARSLEEASKTFGGPVELAEACHTYDL